MSRFSFRTPESSFPLSRGASDTLSDFLGVSIHSLLRRSSRGLVQQVDGHALRGVFRDGRFTVIGTRACRKFGVDTGFDADVARGAILHALGKSKRLVDKDGRATSTAASMQVVVETADELESASRALRGCVGEGVVVSTCSVDPGIATFATMYFSGSVNLAPGRATLKNSRIVGRNPPICILFLCSYVYSL